MERIRTFREDREADVVEPQIQTLFELIYKTFQALSSVGVFGPALLSVVSVLDSYHLLKEATSFLPETFPD